MAADIAGGQSVGNGRNRWRREQLSEHRLRLFVAPELDEALIRLEDCGRSVWVQKAAVLTLSPRIVDMFYRNMGLIDAEMQHLTAADRREVDPPVEVQTATWTQADQLDWW